MIKLAVLADDITGANDTALQFAKHGISSYVKIALDHHEEQKENAGVIVIDTESRDIAQKDAYYKVKHICESLLRSGNNMIYKKVDSTLRGNLGAEIEAAVSVFEPQVVIIAPAYPSQNRVTVGGYHLLNHLPIELTEISNAPKSPVRESRIIQLLQQQTDAKIGLVSLNIVMAGADAIRQAILECLSRGENWIVFDAVLDEHLGQIADVGKSFPKVLWVGSAGLAKQLPIQYSWQAEKKRKQKPGQGTVLAIAGSVSKVTQAQIRRALTLPQTQLIKVNVVALFDNTMTEINRCVREAQATIDHGKDGIITSAVDEWDVADAVAAGEKYGINSVEVSERLAMALAEIVTNLPHDRLAGMVLTGGDTAIHVCRSLGVKAVEVLEEVTAGIPFGRMIGGSCNELPIVTKAGAFGREDSLILSMQALRDHNIDLAI